MGIKLFKKKQETEDQNNKKSKEETYRDNILLSHKNCPSSEIVDLGVYYRTPPKNMFGGSDIEIIYRKFCKCCNTAFDRTISDLYLIKGIELEDVIKDIKREDEMNVSTISLYGIDFKVFYIHINVNTNIEN